MLTSAKGLASINKSMIKKRTNSSSTAKAPQRTKKDDIYCV